MRVSDLRYVPVPQKQFVIKDLRSTVQHVSSTNLNKNTISDLLVKRSSPNAVNQAGVPNTSSSKASQPPADCIQFGKMKTINFPPLDEISSNYAG